MKKSRPIFSPTMVLRNHYMDASNKQRQLPALQLTNTMTRQKEVFKSLKEGYVGMYVCGPTLYSDAHLGNCRTFFSFDVVYRYLRYLGYKVRYVRNITDVGHLVGDVDCDAEDKIAKQARLEQLEPMEVVQKYTNQFHGVMQQLNILPPSIEPRATGHIIEQIEMVQEIINNGYAYEKNGSVYFDTQKLIREGKDLYAYGTLSGKRQDDLLTETRDDLKKQDEKRHPSDFAIWVKASPNHIMRWKSPWSVGYPGWHLECSAMSTKYLGKTFDIHGGGMDLEFPHHENEIAQNVGACGCQPVNYWLHANMLLLNGRKMSKSTGNSISPAELFNGTNDLLSKAYSPMTFRYFMLQAHYSNELNITEGGLQAAEKGYHKLMATLRVLRELDYGVTVAQPTEDDALINRLLDMVWTSMSDDFNTAAALGKLNGVLAKVQALHKGRLPMHSIQTETLARMQQELPGLVYEVMGLQDEVVTAGDEQQQEQLNAAMQVVLQLRQQARERKDWATSDQIRDQLQAVGIQIKDGKEGATWSVVD